jgi:hypothetical protein
MSGERRGGSRAKKLAGVARGLALPLVTLVLLAIPAASASAGVPAIFPIARTPLEISHDLSLQQAAQAGILQLSAKGGFEGDVVQLELEGNKKINSPIVVSLHVEMTVEPSKTPAEREAIRDLAPYLEEQTEKELNKGNYKTAAGNPISFNLEYSYREPQQAPNPGDDQIKIIDPLKDLPKPNPNFRSKTQGLGLPNGEKVVSGTFSTKDLSPSVLAHESLHLMGLPDRYTDVYEIGNRQIPLPKKDMSPEKLQEFLKSVKPPVPLPPEGEVSSKNTPGTGRCDIMGTGLNSACRKISKRDLKWFESQAGVAVETHPGEVLLNKDSTSQNLAVAYPTRVFAPPNGKTTAPGVSVYCVDHSKLLPAFSGFDVGPATAQLPGFEGVGKLLALNAQVQPSLTESLPAMQNAIWNLTDGSSLEGLGESSGLAAEARQLMAQAGVAENSNPNGLTHLGDPNAAAPATAAVDAAGAVLPPIAAEALAAPAPIRLESAQLLPAKVAAGAQVRSTLLVAFGGEAAVLTLSLQARKGHHWKKLRPLPGGKLEAGTETGNAVIPLKLGALKPGKYRLQVTAAGPSGAKASTTAALTVR